MRVSELPVLCALMYVVCIICVPDGTKGAVVLLVSTTDLCVCECEYECVCVRKSQNAHVTEKYEVSFLLGNERC